MYFVSEDIKVSQWLSILLMVVLMWGLLRVNEVGVFLFQRRSAVPMVNISFVVVLLVFRLDTKLLS